MRLEVQKGPYYPRESDQARGAWLYSLDLHHRVSIHMSHRAASPGFIFRHHLVRIVSFRTADLLWMVDRLRTNSDSDTLSAVYRQQVIASHLQVCSARGSPRKRSHREIKLARRARVRAYGQNIEANAN